MKRSGPLPPARQALSRQTPLRRGAPLVRRTPLAPTPWPAQAGQVHKPRPVRDTGPRPKIRALVRARCADRCEWPGCWRARTDIHHRLSRKAGGRYRAMRLRLNGAAWLLGVCPTHHRGVTSATGAELRLARAWGWVLIEGQDAAAVAVLTRHADRPVLLDDGGGWTVAP